MNLPVLGHQKRRSAITVDGADWQENQMLNFITSKFRSLGLLPTPLTPQQMLLNKQYDLAMRIRAVQMNALYNGTGYRGPFEGW